jgi:predicted DNA binding CopG/RHH family protein
MQMTTSGYISALQGLRAVWGWIRKKEDDESLTTHEQRLEDVRQARELAVARAEAEQAVANVRVNSEKIQAKARAELREQRLQPIMDIYDRVQANKRARDAPPQPTVGHTSVDE